MVKVSRLLACRVILAADETKWPLWFVVLVSVLHVCITSARRDSGLRSVEGTESIRPLYSAEQIGHVDESVL